MNALICAVTGSNGYLGKTIVKTLRAQNYRVFELARDVKKAVLPEYFLPFSLHNSILPDLKNIDVLIHCAYDFSADTLEKSKKINLEGSMRLLHHAKACEVKKIIIISSMSAFEGTKSVYGKTKLALEKQAALLGAIIVHPGLIFGENPQGIVGAMKKFVKKSPIVPLIGMGKQRFYPCFIDDLCQLIIYLMHHDVGTKPIIAANEKYLTFREIVLEFAKAENKKVLLIPIPFTLLWAGLFLLEKLHIKIGLRSDSLIGAQYYDKNPDFSRGFISV